MNIMEAVQRYGFVGTVKKAVRVGVRMTRGPYYRWATRNAPRYKSPNEDELKQIERDLTALGIAIEDYRPSLESFQRFKEANYFPTDYHGGINGRVWDEKLLEHWISSELLSLSAFKNDDIYVDIAACASPWAKILRERRNIQAFAIDLDINPEFRKLRFYRRENATKTAFQSGSVRGASLHCAYEMFAGSDDMNLIPELARILKQGGKAVILPLYMHTHYCAYATPESYGKGYADPRAKEYVRTDTVDIASSRKYDAAMLKERVLDKIDAAGLQWRLLVLRNKGELGRGVYCHFILEITRPSSP